MDEKCGSSMNAKTFQRKCLNRIICIFWPSKISNHELFCRCKTSPVGEIIKCRGWRWLGLIVRKPKNDNC
jgi:hypothetical protein